MNENRIRFIGVFVLMLICCNPVVMFAIDTIQVITHHREVVVTNPSTGIHSYPRWGIFPSDDVPVRKIIMHVRFGCPDSLRCADWDYSDQIRIFRKGGVNGELIDFEVGRIITPYGGFFGKDWGFEWEVDVTDFSLLLRDSVEITYMHSGYEPNNDRGWLVTIDFEFITGSPPATPISIVKLYDGSFPYGDSASPIAEAILPVSFIANDEASFARLRLIQTGHGMDAPDNCAEFCDKYRELWYDGSMIEKKQVWKKCGDNPLYPQAGTWIFDRANWCPGYLAQPEIYNLPVSPHKEHTIGLKMQAYTSPEPSANQVISAYLIQYQMPAAETDIAIEDVVVPSGKHIHQRLNPSGANPVIIVKNNGNMDITDLIIEYGTHGFAKNRINWKGFIASFQSDTIRLPGKIQSQPGVNHFEVTLLSPNGKTDAYPADNQMNVAFYPAPIHQNRLMFYLLTNNEPEQNAYSLKNSDGITIKERTAGSLLPKTEYRDTISLIPDAYQLTFIDSGGDGLEFWYNTKGGFGAARLMDDNGNLLKSFESDCGSGWIYNFVIGSEPDKINPNDHAISLYPARTTDYTTLRYFSNKTADVLVRLVTDPGASILEEHSYPNLKEGSFAYDLRRHPFGRFYLKVIVDDEEIFNKRIRYVEPLPQSEESYTWPSDPEVSRKLHQWQDWKFGVIIHWGPYSEWGIVESWSLCPEDEPWCERRGPFADDYCTYVREYEKIRHSFNPQQFDPQQWAEACANAGMKYLVFTTKHHDGFCMYDSRYTDYKITGSESIFSTDPRSNITQNVFSAFREKGMGVGVYFSKADWHNEDYWWPYFPVFDRNVNYDPGKYPERWQRFREFTFKQLEELMTDYGNVDLLWLDGGWVRPAGTLTEETRPWLGKNQWVQDIDMPAIAVMARKQQPGLLIVDRTVHGEFENYRTPEQQIPGEIPAYPWESCITLGDSWYHTGEREHYKTATWAIQTLVKIVAKGGNLLLGIGPDKTGAMPPEVYKRLEEIGKWMNINSQAIYETKPLAPYQEGKWCFTQSKDGKTRYAFYMKEEGEVLPETLELPAGFVKQVGEVDLLGYSGKLEIMREEKVALIVVPGSFVEEGLGVLVLGVGE